MIPVMFSFSYHKYLRMMLIYLEEYPKTHLTTVVMEMNSVYSWVKVEVFNQFLDIGVQSLIISNKGELDLVSFGLLDVGRLIFAPRLSIYLLFLTGSACSDLPMRKSLKSCFFFNL